MTLILYPTQINKKYFMWGLNIVAKNNKTKKLKIYTQGENPNFTSKEVEETIEKMFTEDYQIDTKAWSGTIAVITIQK